MPRQTPELVRRSGKLLRFQIFLLPAMLTLPLGIVLATDVSAVPTVWTLPLLAYVAAVVLGAYGIAAVYVLVSSRGLESGDCPICGSRQVATIGGVFYVGDYESGWVGEQYAVTNYKNLRCVGPQRSCTDCLLRLIPPLTAQFRRRITVATVLFLVLLVLMYLFLVKGNTDRGSLIVVFGIAFVMTVGSGVAFVWDYRKQLRPTILLKRHLRSSFGCTHSWTEREYLALRLM